MTHPAGSLLDHDHGCLLYGSAGERMQAGTAFASAAFADGAQVVYLAAGRPAALALDELAASGLDDCAARVSSGQLRVASAEDAYLTSGRFRPAEMIDLLRTEVDEAIATGWSGLRVAGEMGWASDAGCDAVSLVGYECEVDLLFRSARAAALCMYDRELLGMEFCGDIARVHQLVLGDADDDRPLCRLHRGRDGMIVLAGDLDVSNADAVVASLRLEAQRREHVRLDLTALDFADAYSFGRLAELERELRANHRSVTIVRRSPSVRRVMDLLGDPCRDWLPGEAA